MDSALFPLRDGNSRNHYHHFLQAYLIERELIIYIASLCPEVKMDGSDLLAMRNLKMLGGDLEQLSNPPSHLFYSNIQWLRVVSSS